MNEELKRLALDWLNGKSVDCVALLIPSLIEEIDRLNEACAVEVVKTLAANKVIAELEQRAEQPKPSLASPIMEHADAMSPAMAEQPKPEPVAPKINIRCDMRTGFCIGSMRLNVVRVEPEDDGSFTAVTEDWPATAPPAIPEGLVDAANRLLHQIDIGDFVDSHGHSAKMLKPVHDLMQILADKVQQP